MGYDNIAPLRNLFARDSEGLLNQTQRLILQTIVTYESDGKGCFVGYDRLAAETGLKKRALQENLHYLGDGLVWKDGERNLCTNTECKAHLKIVKTSHYARRGKQQVLRTDLRAYERELSMRDGAPFEVVSMQSEVAKGVPVSEIVSATAHPYKQEIQDKQLQESYAVRLQSYLRTKLPNSKRFGVTPALIQICDELEHKGTSFKAIEAEISAVDSDSILNPKAWVTSRLKDLATREPVWSWDHLPPKCSDADCDSERRTLPYRYEIRTNPPGGTSNECPACNPNAKNRESA